MSTSMILSDQNLNANDVDIMVFEPYFMVQTFVYSWKHFKENSKILVSVTLEVESEGKI